MSMLTQMTPLPRLVTEIVMLLALFLGISVCVCVCVCPICTRESVYGYWPLTPPLWQCATMFRPLMLLPGGILPVLNVALLMHLMTLPWLHVAYFISLTSAPGWCVVLLMPLMPGVVVVALMPVILLLGLSACNVVVPDGTVRTWSLYTGPQHHLLQCSCAPGQCMV